MLIRLNKVPFKDNVWNLSSVFNINRTKEGGSGGGGGERERGAEEGKIGGERGAGGEEGRELWWTF